MFGIKPITSKISWDCGATCLQMLLSYYGHDVDLKQLTEECHTKPIIGCTGADINRAGRLHGLDMTSYKHDLDDVIKSDRPMICHWCNMHYVIYDGLDDAGNVVVIDPDVGMLHMSKELFNFYFTKFVFVNGKFPEDDEDEEEGEEGEGQEGAETA